MVYERQSSETCKNQLCNKNVYVNKKTAMCYIYLEDAYCSVSQTLSVFRAVQFPQFSIAVRPPNCEKVFRFFTSEAHINQGFQNSGDRNAA